MEDVKNYYLKIRISLGKMKKTHKAITIPQLLAILYRKPEYIYGLRCNGGADLLDDLNACDINNPDVLSIIKIFSFVQKNCMPKGIKRYPALVGLTRYIFDNENTIDLDKFYNKLDNFNLNLVVLTANIISKSKSFINNISTKNIGNIISRCFYLKYKIWQVQVKFLRTMLKNYFFLPKSLVIIYSTKDL